METRDNCFVVTYEKDKAVVVERFKKLIVNSVYREKLYSDFIPCKNTKNGIAFCIKSQAVLCGEVVL